MKNFALQSICVLLMVMMASAAYSQNKKPENLVRFKNEVNDIGKIKQGQSVIIDVDFDNISDEPVEVESVIAPCGCTVIEKPSLATAKGKSGKIKVEFTPIRTGPFERKFTVKLAGAARPLIVTITGEVLNPKSFDEYAKAEN